MNVYTPDGKGLTPKSEFIILNKSISDDKSFNKFELIFYTKNKNYVIRLEEFSEKMQQVISSALTHTRNNRGVD